jgi:competence protein ComFC
VAGGWCFGFDARRATALENNVEQNECNVSAAISNIKTLLNAGLAFVYPESCQLCGEERAKVADGLVCSNCWQQVRFIRPPFCDRCGLPFEGDITTKFECGNCKEMELHFSSARSAAVMASVVRETILSFKYQRALWFEPFLADLFLREAVPVLREQKWDCIVPVPLHSVKEREREFNQAERLGSHLARALKIPMRTEYLKRVLPTDTQTRLKKQERAANMRNAFALQKDVKSNGERVVLVDDVFTTGATTSACAKVLLKAGASEVCVWTVARGL